MMRVTTIPARIPRNGVNCRGTGDSGKKTVSDILISRSAWKLTNLQLSHFSGEDIHHYGLTGAVTVDGPDEQVDLLAGVEPRHRELRRGTGDVGQVGHGEAVHYLQHEHLLQPAVKAGQAIHLEEFHSLRGGKLKYFCENLITFFAISVSQFEEERKISLLVRNIVMLA